MQKEEITLQKWGMESCHFIWECNAKVNPMLPGMVCIIAMPTEFSLLIVFTHRYLHVLNPQEVNY